MIDTIPKPLAALRPLMTDLDDGTYDRYQSLVGSHFQSSEFRLEIVHVQGSPGALPASVCRIKINIDRLGIPGQAVSTENRRMATADFLLRAFDIAVAESTRPNRGSQGSGSFQPLNLPQQILLRNIVDLHDHTVGIHFCISLPGSRKNRIMGKDAADMFDLELPEIVRQLQQAIKKSDRLRQHWQTVEDAEFLREQLKKLGLIGFIADGSLLPRQSGISDLPMVDAGTLFNSPAELAVEVELPHAGRVRGMGIPQGVTCVIGGGYHGKSTLLAAIARGVYPHVPGDGRERIVTVRDALLVKSEAGRVVRGTNISAFINNLPDNTDSREFFTDNASGSTSQAASVIEGLQAGSSLLLIDEDCSASNFLNRDANMRQLIPEDPITPLFDRIRELYDDHGVSVIIIAGGNSGYLAVSDNIIAMGNYQPAVMNKAAKALQLATPSKPTTAMDLIDRRFLTQDNFDPSYTAKRLGKTIPVRIKPLRKQSWVLEYGDDDIDLGIPAAIVDPDQTLAIGHALFTAREQGFSGTIEEMIEKLITIGIAHWKSPGPPRFMALPRPLEIAAAINRLRSLRVIFK